MIYSVYEESTAEPAFRSYRVSRFPFVAVYIIICTAYIHDNMTTYVRIFMIGNVYTGWFACMLTTKRGYIDWWYGMPLYIDRRTYAKHYGKTRSSHTSSCDG